MRCFLNKLLRVVHPYWLPGPVGASRRASPKGTFKPQFEALEQREVMSVTSGAVAALPTSAPADAGSVLANPTTTSQTPGSISNWVLTGGFEVGGKPPITNTEVFKVSTPAPPARPTRTLEQKLDIKYEVFTLYNQDLTNTEQAISNYLSNPMNTGGHTFSNIQVSLPFALPSELLELSVDPKNNSFTLVHYSGTGTLTGNVDGVSLQMTFNMVLTMSFTTRGASGNGPIALTSASIGFTNALANLGWPATLDDQLKLQQTFDTAQADATAIIQGLLAKSPDVALLNAALISYAPRAIVSPFFDASNGIFDLLVSSASTAPAAPAVPALAQISSPTSTPTTLVFSSQKPIDALVADTDVPVSHAMLQSLAGIGHGVGAVSSKAGTDISVSLDAFSAK